MTHPINQDEINAILWKASDTFRGAIDPSEYKSYILVVLFLKYISDVWQDHYAKLMEVYGDDDVRIRRHLEKERFLLPEGADFYTLYASREAPDIGERINEALAAIENANREKLENVFRNIDFDSEAALGRTKQRNERLKHLLEDFHDPRLDMRPSRVGSLDVIGNGYEYLIGKFASGAGKKAGEFYTPPEVSLLLAELLDPQPGESICDPACGSGSLLIKCARHAGNDSGIYGMEANGATWALCMMNLFLHNIDVTTGTIHWTDTLKDPRLLEGNRLRQFNVVVANPPFSLDKWGAEHAASDPFARFHRGVPPKSKGDYAFLSHMVETMCVDPAENGRAGVVVPLGVLFRGGKEGAIRKKLIEENLLDTVIGLPANLFYGTGIPAAILLFKRHRPDHSILFIDASRDAGQYSTRNYLREEDRAKILDTCMRRKPVEKYAYVAKLEEIAENDFTLNIPRYVDTFEEEPPIDLAALNTEIKTLRKDLREMEARMDTFLEDLGFGG